MGRLFCFLGVVYDLNFFLVIECGFVDIYFDDKRIYLEVDVEKFEMMWCRVVVVVDVLCQVFVDKLDLRFESIEKL